MLPNVEPPGKEFQIFSVCAYAILPKERNAFQLLQKNWYVGTSVGFAAPNTLHFANPHSTHNDPIAFGIFTAPGALVIPSAQ